jgi:hypothetical protein
LSNLSCPFSHKSLRHRRNPNLVSLPSHRSRAATAFPSHLATYRPSLRSLCQSRLWSTLSVLIFSLGHGFLSGKKGNTWASCPITWPPSYQGVELPYNRWVHMTPMVVTWHREVRIKFKFGTNPKIMLTPSKPIWTTYFLHGLDTDWKFGPLMRHWLVSGFFIVFSGFPTFSLVLDFRFLN